MRQGGPLPCRNLPANADDFPTTCALYSKRPYNERGSVAQARRCLSYVGVGEIEVMVSSSLFSRRALIRRLVPAVLAAGLVGVLPVSAQTIPPYGTGVEPLLEAGLMTVVDQTSEADGMQVTIQYAYADTQRIIVRLKLSGDYEQVLQDNMPNLVLRDDTGYQFGYNAMQPVLRVDDEQAEIFDAIFYTQAAFQGIDGEVDIIDDYLNDKGEGIDLQLDLGFTPLSALGMVLDAAEALEKSPVGPFGFVFTVPIYHAREIKPMETITVADIAMTLERVTVAPSETEVQVCYSLPDAQDWQPWIELTADGVPAPLTGGNLVGLPTLDDTERCIEQRFAVLIGDTTESLTVDIDRLQTSVPDAPEAWEGFVAELETLGIKAEAFPERGAYFSIESTPEGMTDAELGEIIDAARENMRQSIAGPWTFEVSLAD